MWCNYYAVTSKICVCVCIPTESTSNCPLAYENTSLQCVGLFAANTLGAGTGSYLLVMLYRTWTSDGLRKHVKCTILSNEFICNTSEKYVLWKKELW